jgi:hypothetical protein
MQVTSILHYLLLTKLFYAIIFAHKFQQVSCVII